MNKEYIKSYAFSLADICEGVSTSSTLGVGVPTFQGLATKYDVDLSDAEVAEFTSGKSAKLWSLIFLRYADNFVTIKEVDSFTKADFIVWLNAFVNLYKRTYESYNAVINNYENVKNNLLKQVGTNSKTRFNDTPQESGVYETDNYNTSVTMNETLTDVNTPIARIREIENNISNYFAEWADEFSGIFINELNY